MGKTLSALFGLYLAFIFIGGTGARAQKYECEEDLIEVMFAENSRVRLRGDVLVDLTTNALDGLDQVLQGRGQFEWQRICDLPEETLDEFQSRGEFNTGQPVYNLNNAYRLRIPAGEDVWQISQELERLPGILLARPVPKPMPAPWPGNYESQQKYLDPATPAPSGIDARYAWTQAGGTGTNVTVCDIEYAWNYSHADITKASGSQINPNPLSIPPGETDNHGTAVIGELVANNNAWGITGICYGANLKTCGSYYGSTPQWNVAGAIAYAIAALSAGDVILLEQQWDYGDPTTAYPDYIPIEWWTNYYPNQQSPNVVYAAIVNAVANGIHVVEAGGNGGAPTMNVGVNTDNLTWYGNSGAIIVGAGGAYTGGTYPEGNLERISFSSYGSRYDLQGWGENVWTTGYGDYYSADGKNYYYTNTFAGTSSASPIVAGAIACCVGYWKAQGWNPAILTPALMRNILFNTGTPQVFGPAGNIGPRPNLLAAFALLGPFVNATTTPLADNGRGCGVGWADYDKDGDLDLYLANEISNNKLLRNDGSGVFTDVTGGPLGFLGAGGGMAWGDYDNDNDLDLIVANWGNPLHLLRNDGGGTFTNVTSGPLANNIFSNSLCWGDYDNDGDIDLFVVGSNEDKLFRNDGGGNFSDASVGHMWFTQTGMGCAWGDYDNDNDLDLFVSNYGGSYANWLFRNDAGTLTYATPPAMVDFGNGTGVDWGDYDNDGDLDLYLGNFGSANKLYRNDGGGAFTDVTAYPLNHNGQTESVSWVDYDNDGDLDLFVVDWGGLNKLFRNDGAGAFADATTKLLADSARNGRGCSWGDYDNDGDLDLYLANDLNQPNVLLRNQIGSGNHWLHVNLIGTVSNRAAIGARVRVCSGTLKQIREISGGSGLYSQHSLTAEFGLGSHTTIDSLEVKWPSGIITTMTTVPIDMLMVIIEPAPYICGDANADATVDVSDAVWIINYVFVGGAPPNPMASGDANCDTTVDVSDAVWIINYVFVGGNQPCDTNGDQIPDC